MTQPVTDLVTGESTNETYEYEEEVPYIWTICNVTPENFDLSHVPVYIMSAGQLFLYATHIVFAPKYRRMAIYGQILRKLCEQKGMEIIEAQACPDHIQMLSSIPPKYSVS